MILFCSFLVKYLQNNNNIFFLVMNSVITTIGNPNIKQIDSNTFGLFFKDSM